MNRTFFTDGTAALKPSAEKVGLKLIECRTARQPEHRLFDKDLQVSDVLNSMQGFSAFSDKRERRAAILMGIACTVVFFTLTIIVSL